MEEVNRKRKLPKIWYYIVVSLSVLGIVISINQIFSLNLIGFQPYATSYLYYIIAIFLSIVFLIYPATKKSSRDSVPWYDVLLFVTSIIINIYFAINAINIVNFGWELIAPVTPTVFSIILWALVIEAVRRVAGISLAIVCLIFSFYPIYAGLMPAFLKGPNFDIFETARNHAMSLNSILGIPLQTVGSLIIGFMLFGVVLQRVGAGDFFIKLALALFGKSRGGAAKVAVISSAFFASLSGSAISNVATTGAFTIPAMKRTGYKPHYAGAVEACASTGGIIMPPVMGSVAFVMASFMGQPYTFILIAAIIPALLYFISIYFQVDTYAFKNDIKGMPKSELPPIRETLKEGWYFLFSIVVLVYFIFTLRLEAWAPYYASALLILLSYINKKNRLTLKRFGQLFHETGRILAELVAILAAVGLLVGALSLTGVAFSFSRELVMMVGDNLFLLVVAAALTSFILGFGMTATSVYIFLAIVVVPALVNMGIEPIAAHFFVLYWGIISSITPPVATAAYAAAGIAESDPMKTGFTSMKLGLVKYIIPFFFVYNPALLAQGSITEILFTFITAVIGIYLMAAGLDGVILSIRNLNKITRIYIFSLGILLLFPNWLISSIALGVLLITVILFSQRKNTHEKTLQS